jgi:hypothetical protein
MLHEGEVGGGVHSGEARAPRSDEDHLLLHLSASLLGGEGR